MHAVRRLLHLSLGDLREPGRDSRPTWLLAVVVSAAVLSMLLDTKHSMKGDPLVHDSWTFAVYGALPLATVTWWEVRRSGREHLLAALGTLGVVVPIAAHVATDAATRSMREEPLWMLVPTAVGSALLLLAAWRSGGKLSDHWGIGLGDWRWWGPRMAVLGTLVVPMVVLTAWAFPEMREFYPQYRPARKALSALVYYQASMGLYMLGWELFFRGFLLHGLARRGDAVMALFFHSVPFFLLHRGKPEAEMLSSYVGSLLIGWFSLRSRSFVPAWLLHWGMNLSMELTAFLWRHYG